MNCSKTALWAALLLLSGCSKQGVPERAPANSEPVTAAPSAALQAFPTANGVPSAPRAADAGAHATTSDVVSTSRGELRIVPLQHASLRLDLGSLHVYVDPTQSNALSDAPKADLVLVTDIHADHYDAAAIGQISKPETQIVAPAVVTEKVPQAIMLKNGDTRAVLGLSIRAVPMYNLRRGPKPGALFHDKGRGNGYIVSIGATRLYLAGDTECTPEMRALENIDIAFVPMNLPYTMPPEEAAECVQAFRPRVVYPYHYRGSDLGVFRQALAGIPTVEVRVRDWYPGGG